MEKTINEALNNTSSLTVDRENKIVVIHDSSNLASIYAFVMDFDPDNISKYVVLTEQFYEEAFSSNEDDETYINVYPNNMTSTH